MFCTIGKTEKHKNCIFTQICISALPEFNQSLPDFFNPFDSRLILTLVYDSLNLVINAFSLGLLSAGGTVQEKGSRQRCSSWTALSSGFPLSQGNAEALDRWGGKTKQHLISYFLSQTSAKNYRNRIVYVKILASQRWGVFRDTVYIVHRRNDEFSTSKELPLCLFIVSFSAVEKNKTKKTFQW